MDKYIVERGARIRLV